MKLDKHKIYDLSDLTSEELKELGNNININIYKKHTGIAYYNNSWKAVYWNKKDLTHNAKELFTDHIEHNLEMIAYKEKATKLDYELDFNFITQLAERMNVNKGKYEPYNWQKLDNIEDLKQALFRHVMEVMKGDYEDDTRLFGHLEAIALNSMFINYQLNKNESNNN